MLIRFSVLLNFEKSFDFRDHRLLAWFKIMLTTRLLRCFKRSFVWRWGGSVQFSSVHLLSCVRLFATPWTAAHQTFLSITNSQSSPKLVSIESVMPSNHLILCCPVLLLPSIFPASRYFQMSQPQVAKVLEFQLQHQSFQWTPRTDLL